MRKPRTVEAPQDRQERRKREAQERVAEIAAEDRAIDAMIKQNIEAYGP